MAEHHGMANIATSAPEVLIAHLAGVTSRMRIGSGGIMLPNHSPLQIAEQFGTLDALFPGRIDLGLGRAPGSDQKVSQAIRRSLSGGADQFPRDVIELHAENPDYPTIVVEPGEPFEIEGLAVGLIRNTMLM